MLEYRVDVPRQLIRVTVRGADNSCAMLEELWGKMYRDPQYDPAFHHLWLLDEDAGGPIENQVIQLRSMLEVMAESQPVAKKWAIVLPSTWKRLMAETAFRGMQLGRVQLRFHALEEDALRWLGAAPPASNLTGNHVT